MSPKHRNLLEAFKSSGAEASLPAASVSSPRGASAAGSSGSSGSGGRTSSARLQMLVLAQLILLVVAFLLGRASVKSVDASEPSGDSAGRDLGATPPSNENGSQPDPGQAAVQTPAPPAPDPSAAQVDPRPQTDAERALLDPANQYTIKLVEYAHTGANLKLAQDTLRYVTGTQQMPACLAGAGTRLYVLIGAAPTKAELESLLERARKMNGPPPLSKRGEFHDAYPEKIDKVFKRK